MSKLLDIRLEALRDLEDGRRDQLSLLNGKLKEERAKAEAALEEERARVARKLLARNYALEDIVDISGLTAEQVGELMRE